MNFKKIFKPVYGLPNCQTPHCDVVVALGYGFTQSQTLPRATVKVLETAAALANEYRAPVAWASSNYFFTGCKEAEDSLKQNVLAKAGHLRPPIVAGTGISNSVTEAREIRRALEDAGIQFKDILVVLDWPHARSARIIWENVFHDATVHFWSVDAEWDETHAAKLQRSNLLWLTACLLRHMALRTKGIEWVAKIQHPTNK